MGIQTITITIKMWRLTLSTFHSLKKRRNIFCLNQPNLSLINRTLISIDCLHQTISNTVNNNNNNSQTTTPKIILRLQICNGDDDFDLKSEKPNSKFKSHNNNDNKSSFCLSFSRPLSNFLSPSSLSTATTYSHSYQGTNTTTTFFSSFNQPTQPERDRLVLHRMLLLSVCKTAFLSRFVHSLL